MKQFRIEDKINYKNTFPPLMEELVYNNIGFTCYAQGLKIIVIEEGTRNLKTVEDILSKYSHLNVVIKVRKRGKWITEE